VQHDVLDLSVSGTPVRLAYQRRPGPGVPLLSLDGFGSTKEDYADLALRPDFNDRDLIAWDAPDVLSITFLVDVKLAACDALGIDGFHLSGHSMGSLTALMLAQAHPSRVLSFFYIEGNVAPEDCFLSRQIIDFPADTPEDFFQDFQTRVRSRPESSLALYTTTLPLKVRATTVRHIFTSMIARSDTKPLMDMLAGLPCPKAFVHGTQNNHLSYLPHLPNLGVQVIPIDHSGHFPMYSPPHLWTALAQLLTQAEAPA